MSIEANKTIFGFGSLIFKPSLLATAPSATDIQPAYIKGFTRSFSVWDPVGWTETNLDVAGEPMYALDVVRALDKNARVNGVTFTIDETDVANLLRREENYELINTSAYSYETDQLITGDCLVFSANKNNGKYVYDGKAQQRYLEDYLKAAKEYGDRFYQEILDTTFIDGQKLIQVSKLSKLIENISSNPV